MYKYPSKVEYNPQPIVSATSSSFLVQYAVFKLIEFTLGVSCFSLLATQDYSDNGMLHILMFVSATSWTLTVISLGVYFISTYIREQNGSSYDISEFVFNLIWCLLYFIAACGAITGASFHNTWIASTVIAWFITLIYAAHAFYAFRRWRSSWMWDLFTRSSYSYKVPT